MAIRLEVLLESQDMAAQAQISYDMIFIPRALENFSQACC